MKKIVLLATTCVAGLMSAKEVISVKTQKDEKVSKEFKTLNEKAPSISSKEAKCYNRDKTGKLHQVDCPDVIIM